MTMPDWSEQVAEWADAWHEDLVRFLARRTVTRADAQDIAQEVYLRLLRLDRSDVIRQPRSYLLRIAANLLYEWQLKARQSRPHDEPLELLESPDNPQADTAAAHRSQQVERELGRLPAPVRLALTLQINGDLTHEEIAAQMKVTKRMVKRYLLVAYSTLRARLPKDL